MFLSQPEVKAAQKVLCTYSGYVLKTARVSLLNLAKHLPNGMVTEAVVTSSLMSSLSGVQLSFSTGEWTISAFKVSTKHLGKKKKLQITFSENPMQSF